MKPTIQWPIDGQYPLTFLFGEAPAWYVNQFGYPHNGVDIGCPIGTPVRACDDGTVSVACSVADSAGEGIFLAHAWGQSEYWHLSQLIAKIGQVVKKGDIIGLSGDTGFATGPHLHFGTMVVGVSPDGMRGWSNPLDYLPAAPIEPPAPEPIGRKYTVVSGDTLWSLAVHFYGDGSQWRVIADANKDIISNPNLIRPGQILNIP